MLAIVLIILWMGLSFQSAFNLKFFFPVLNPYCNFLFIQAVYFLIAQGLAFLGFDLIYSTSIFFLLIFAISLLNPRNIFIKIREHWILLGLILFISFLIYLKDLTYWDEFSNFGWFSINLWKFKGVPNNSYEGLYNDYMLIHSYLWSGIGSF